MKKGLHSLLNGVSNDADSRLILWIGASTVGVVVIFVLFALTGGFGSGSPSSNATSQLAKNPKTAYAALISDANDGKYDVACSYQKPDVVGKFYVTRNAVRFQTETSNGVVHLLRLGSDLYLWNDASNSGLRFDIGVTGYSEQADLQQYDENELVKNGEQYHLACTKVQSLDRSLFVVPDTISFTDLSAGQ